MLMSVLLQQILLKLGSWKTADPGLHESWTTVITFAVHMLRGNDDEQGKHLDWAQVNKQGLKVTHVIRKYWQQAKAWIRRFRVAKDWVAPD